MHAAAAADAAAAVNEYQLVFRNLPLVTMSISNEISLWPWQWECAYKQIGGSKECFEFFILRRIGKKIVQDNVFQQIWCYKIYIVPNPVFKLKN